MRRYIRNKQTGEYLKNEEWTKHRWEATSFSTIPEAIRAGIAHPGEIELVLLMQSSSAEIPFPVREFESEAAGS